ncbi:hypothetical protein [Prevotella sp. P3-122]|uniref:hypothetical protein n=1 Tax=Prevotella sp. P3-122 TaxID=2024223 RepID=UPI00113FC62D|nr:hypothetical protein [Prevotella sp. P3-122]
MKRIIRIMALAMFMVCMSMGANAQNKQKKDGSRMSVEQLTELRAKRIAQALALDDATAQKFTTTFCACQKELYAANKAMKENKGKKRSEMTDAEIETIQKDRFKQSRKLLDLREKYYGEYRKFLSARQVQRVYELEKQDFKKFAIHAAKNKKAPARKRK